MTGKQDQTTAAESPHTQPEQDAPDQSPPAPPTTPRPGRGWPDPAHPASAVTELLHQLTARITHGEPAEAVSVLSGVLAEDGVLDAVRGLLDSAIAVVDGRADATRQADNPSVYTLWHILSACADILDDQQDHLHRAPQLLHTLLTDDFTTTRVWARPEPRQPQDWVPPAGIRETPAALDAICERLDTGTTVHSAALLVTPVFDPDGGVLERLSAMLASTSRYAQVRGATPEFWQNLARAGEQLDDLSQTLAHTSTCLAQLPAPASGPQQRSARTQRASTPPVPAAESAASAAGRRRR